MATFKRHGLLFLLVFLFVKHTSGDEPNYSDNNFPVKISNNILYTNDFPNSRPESRTAGLEKLYSMARTFVSDMVLPYTIGELIDAYNIDKFEDFKDESFYGEWKDWGWHYLGFAACLAVGVLFILLLPFFALFYCCCRCCCNSCICCCCRTPKVSQVLPL